MTFYVHFDLCRPTVKYRFRPRTLPVVFAAISLLFAGVLKTFAADAPHCVLVERQGKVEIARKGSTTWSSGATNEVLQVGDRLRTGLRSRATLRWSEASVVRVDQLTSMEIQPPANPTDKPQLDLKSGATYLFSREKPTEVQFRTPVASGAIRGTEFNLKVAEDGRTELALLDGEVTLANAQGSATLGSGEQVTVEPGKAPTKAPLLDAINIIQWVLYYPQVVDPDNLGLDEAGKKALTESLDAYAQGDLLAALARYPENAPRGADGERGLYAALLLAVGQVGQCETELKQLPENSPVARALRELIVAVKHGKLPGLTTPTTASEWMARSYYHQSQGQLTDALKAANEAVAKSPNFGAAYIRQADLQFGFGRTEAALSSLNRGLELSPRNAQGFALRGFLLSARNRNAEAMQSFNQAIALDGALANAWLGRGLLKIRGSFNLMSLPRAGYAEGIQDLQVAATLEPQRSVLRSYLGKAYADKHDVKHADKELALAQKLDPNDPTSWLYSSLLKFGENQNNEAIRDLEKSKALNDSRSIYRSSLLLDQDRAVRSANLAAIYRDAGMFDVSVQEASSAVNADYANASAHQFLASSYDYIRDPKLINLRYETPAYSEYLLANLLSPAGGGGLAQTVSQQEYARFFDSDHLGIFSDTEYSSHGDWVVNGSQYGVLGNTSYSLDGYYRNDRGYRPNNDLEVWNFAGRWKQQLTPQDSVYAEVSTLDLKSGDLAQYYSQSEASTTQRVREWQTPNIMLGYHHEWAPGSHTLLLAGRFDDTLKIEDSDPGLLFLRTQYNVFTGTTNVSVTDPAFFESDYKRDFDAYSFELQQVWQNSVHTVIVGGRFQTADVDADSDLTRTFGGPTAITDQSIDSNMDRESVYAYHYWNILDELQITSGLSYDRLHYPENIDTAPITNEEKTEDRVSPKAGIRWTPWTDTEFRGFYTRSLGGFSLDQSVRLEPTQIAGFNQAFRSLIPESVAGLVPGTRFETFGLGWNQRFKTGTYLLVDAELLKSDATRTVGVLTNSNPFAPIADSASSTRQSLDYKEKSLSVTVNQLVGQQLTLGARYRLTYAELDGEFEDLDPSIAGVPNQDVSGTLHQVWLYGIYNCRCGFFFEADGIWSSQSNSGYAGTKPGDEFWQVNLHAGYRFWNRRAEARIGVLNVTDKDYKLNPLTLYNELPRERAFVAGFKFYF